jgi:PAS domain S-box-containing protein
MKPSTTQLLDALRRRAEAKLSRSTDLKWAGEMQFLIQELEVHQTELELQNIELQDVQNALELARDRYESLYHLAPVGFLTLDKQGRVLECNRNASDWLRIVRTRLIGSSLARYMTREDADRWHVHLKALRPGERRGIDVELINREQRVFPAFISTLFVIENGETRYYTAIIDLTEQRNIENELRARDQELKRSHSRKLEAVGQLSSGLAHDFNNMLMGIIGFLQVALEMLEADHPVRSVVQRSLAAAERSVGLTRRLMSFTHKRPSEPTPIEVDKVLASLEALVRPLLGEHLHYAVSLEAANLHILADNGELEQMLLNLATNARDAMSAGGEFSISTSEVTVSPQEDPCPGSHTRCIRLVVKDTGTGMNPEQIARAFEPFYTTKPTGKGTGLGLATVHSIVKRLGGRVDLKSEVGKGTTFSFYFPIIEPTNCPRAAEGSDSNEETQHGTVLLVEDDEMVRDTVERYLDELGFEVVTAHNAKEAIETCANPQTHVDVLLTDVVMPDKLGTDLAEEARSHCDRLRVLFMSAHGREELSERRGLHEDDALIEKPFTEKQLGAALRRLLQNERNRALH